MRADRLLKMMILLQTQGKMTTQVLADELEVSRRTILRDIDALSIAGVPIYTDGGHGGGVALDDNYRVKLNGLKQEEVQALILSSNTALLADIGLDDAAEQSLLKLLTALPSLHTEAAKSFQNRVHIDPLGWWHFQQKLLFLPELQQAVYADLLITIRYQKRDGDIIQRDVEPYGLVAKAGVWYLIAAHDSNFRTYRVSRLRDMIFHDNSFSRDPDFNLLDYWESTVSAYTQTMDYYRFTLKVQAQKMDFVDFYTADSYSIQSVEDNGLILEFEVGTSELAMMLVFGLGEFAKILAPPELQAAVHERIQRMQAR